MINVPIQLVLFFGGLDPPESQHLPFLNNFSICSETVVRRYSVEKVFLEILHLHFVKFLRTPLFTEHLWWLLLFVLVSLYLSYFISQLNVSMQRSFFIIIIVLVFAVLRNVFPPFQKIYSKK